MKKNKMMRAASVLAVAVLLTTCAISGTFAKYVTRGNAGDSARVAKWGVSVVATTDNIFDATYNDEDATYSGLSVSASEDVVAPGTAKENFTDLTLTGTPEVAVRVEYTAVLVLENWKDANDDEYCPLVFTVEGTEFKIGGTDLEGNSIATITDLKEAVETAVAKCSKDYEPNTNLAQTASTTDAPTISWSWPYHTIDDNDEKDTYLGDVAAGKYDGKSAATISLTTTVTITQID